MSKIYHVYRTDIVGYDEYVEFIVVAKSPGEARQLCSERAADEGKQTWLKASTSVIGIPREHTSRIVVESFNAG